MIAKWTPVSVRWLDADTEYDPARSSDIAKEYKKSIRNTIGWLIYYDRERIVLAMEDDRQCVDQLNDVQTCTTIPKRMLIGEPVVLTPQRSKRKR